MIVLNARKPPGRESPGGYTSKVSSSLRALHCTFRGSTNLTSAWSDSIIGIMRKNHHLAGLILLLLLALLGTTFFFGMRGRSSDLLDNARFVADTRGWLESKWIDDRKILVVTGANGAVSEAFELDSETGRRKSLPGLTGTLRKIGNGCYLRPSPNGKWVLVCRNRAQPFTHVLVRVSDGSVTARLPGMAQSWFPDSSGWMVRHSSGKKVILVSQDGKVRTGGRLPQSGVIGSPLLLTSRGTIITYDYSVYGMTPVQIQWNDLRAGSTAPVRLVHRPRSSYISSVSMSADEKRLVWVVHPLEGPYKWVNRALEWLRRGEDTQEVWVSRADGAAMILLGSCTVSYEMYEGKRVWVEWLPGGRELGITYDQQLYRLPLGEP
jgi:hypothetical protein